MKLLRNLFPLLAAALLLIVSAPAGAQTNVPFRVYLAFEDGPTDAYTPQILDILAEYNARATFLIAGYQISGHEALIQRELREGHAIINHLWEEPGVYAGSDDASVIESYLRTEAAIREAIGPELIGLYDAQMRMFWQPGGGTQPLPYIEGVQVITYNWNVNSDDCGYGLPADIDLDTLEFDQAVIENVLGTPVTANSYFNVFDYGDGAIIVFHDINRVTGRVLPQILSELTRAGATFEALPRPWDQPNTMPVVIGTPPADGVGVPGATMSAITLARLNLRAAPSFDAEVLSVLPMNATVTAVGRAFGDGWGGGWIQVQVEGQTGWVHRPYLRVNGPIPSLPRQG